MKQFSASYLLVPLLARLLISGSNGSLHERKLLTKLFENYNVLERPVLNHSNPVTVVFGISLLSLHNVDEKSGSIDANMWLSIKWYDMNLVWNPMEYDNITDLRLPVQRIWKPDVHLYNSQHELFDPTYETMAVVLKNGSVVYIPPGVQRASCAMDFTYYPLDAQKCTLRFGSWTYNSEMLNLQLESEKGGDMSSYVSNSEWDLTAVPGVLNTITYACCAEPFVDITYTILIQRKGAGILYTSRVVNLFICFMILTSFVMSPASGQKLVIGIGAMICNVWVIGSVNSVLPANHNSLLTQYFERLSSLVLSSIVANVVTIFLHYRICAMPQLVKKIVLFEMPLFLQVICPRRIKYTQVATEMSSNVNSHQARARYSNNDETHDLLSEVEDLKRKVSMQEDHARLTSDWHYLAIIFDRCFIFIYGFCILIFMTGLFPSFESEMLQSRRIWLLRLYKGY